MLLHAATAVAATSLQLGFGGVMIVLVLLGGALGAYIVYAFLKYVNENTE